MKRSFIQIIVSPLLLIFSNNLRAQEVTLDGEIYEYATYYINSFDFNTGATNVQIFRYSLSSSFYPVSLKVMFRASMLSPSLGINSELIISEVITDEFELQAPLILDNRIQFPSQRIFTCVETLVPISPCHLCRGIQ